MKRVVFTIDADEDLDRAVAFYDTRGVALGDQLRDRVAEAAARVAAQPGVGWRVGRHGARRTLVRGYPYSLVYVNETVVVRVVAIPHHSQGHRSWSRLLP